MYGVESIKAGQREYLANTEDKNLQEIHDLAQSKALNHEQFEAYCKENKLDFTRSNFERYLNDGKSHYEAQVSSGIIKVFGIDKYSRKAYEKLMNGENPLTESEWKKINPDLAYKKDGRLVKVNQKQKIGVDGLATAPKSLSILFAVSDRETKNKIARAMFKTADQQLDVLAKQLRPCNTGKKYQDFDPTKTVVFANHYFHTETRPDEKNKAGLSKEQLAQSVDTHIHIHSHISAVAQFAFYKRDKNGEIILKDDGTPDYTYKMYSTDSIELMKRQLENSAQFDCLLNSNLQNEGIKTERHSIVNSDNGTIHETFKVAGVSREMEIACSNRSQNNYEKNKTLSAGQRQKNFKNTKENKSEFGASELERIITNNTVEAIGVDSVNDILEAQKKTEQSYDNKELLTKISNHEKLNLAGIIKDTELRKEVIKSIQFSQNFKSMADIDKAVDETIKDLSNIEKHGKDSLVAVFDNNKKVVGYTRLSNALTERAFVKNLTTLSNDIKLRSKEQVKAEEQVLNDFIKEAKDKGYPFKKGQIEGMKQSLKLGYEIGRVFGENGAPGSGKTSSVIRWNVVLNEFRNNGEQRIIGISTANVATKALADSGIKEDRLFNSAKLIAMAYKQQPDGSYKFNEKFINDPKNQNNLYIFDEFGLEGMEKANLILELSKKTNSNLLYVGDENQLKSVSYGNPMGTANSLLREQDPEKVGVLDEIMRQKNDRALEIVRNIEQGKGDELFKLLEDEKGLTVAKTEKTLINKVANDYVNDNLPEDKKIIVANTNATIDTLNGAIREKLVKENPELYKNEVNLTVARQGTDTDIERKMKFGEGERIVFLKGMKEKDPKTGLPVEGGWSIDNSQLAVISNIKRSQSGSYDITVNTEGNDITFNTAKDGNYFSQAYAVSVYKSQGSTVENVRHISTGGSEPKNSIYVSASRHTGTADKKDEQGNIIEKGELGYHLYVTEDNIDKFKENLNKEQTKFSTLDNVDCDRAVEEYSHKVHQNRLQNYQIPEEVKKQSAIESEMDYMNSAKLDYSNEQKIAEELKVKKELEQKEEKTIDKEGKEVKELEQVKKEEIFIDLQKINELNLIKNQLENDLKNNESLKNAYIEKMFNVERTVSENMNDPQIIEFIKKENSIDAQIKTISSQIEIESKGKVVIVESDLKPELDNKESIEEQKSNTLKAVDSITRRIRGEVTVDLDDLNLSKEHREAMESINKSMGIHKPNDVKANIEKVRKEAEQPKTEQMKQVEEITKKIIEEQKTARERYLEDFAKQGKAIPPLGRTLK